MNQSDSLSAIRRRARLDRHATSYPLIVIGAAGFHYATFRSSIGWLPVVYGMPLAFVVVWALQGGLWSSSASARGPVPSLIMMVPTIPCRSL